MTQEEHAAKLKAFVEDLAPVLKKHKASLWYTINEDGLYVETADMFRSENLGYISNGTSPQIERILKG